MAAAIESSMISSLDLICRASSIACCPSTTLRPHFCRAKIIGSSAMSTPSGSSATPCSRMISLTVRATSSDSPNSGATAPRRPVIPAREFSGRSHGECRRWTLAAEPKSHRIGSPLCVSKAKRATLSRAHSPMCVLVMYRMLFMSNTNTAPRPALAIASRERPRRYSCKRRKSTRSSQSTCMRPGAGSEATGNSGLGMLAGQRLVAQPVGYRSGIGLELEIGSSGFQLEEAGEILVAEPLSNQVDHDLVHQGGDRHGHVRLTPDVEAELEVLSQQMTGEGWREIEVDKRRCLVAAEGGPHHAVVEEIQVVGPRDAAALGQHGGLGHDLRDHTEDEVMADLDQAG